MSSQNRPMVGAAQVYSMLTDGRELALLDVRETGIFTGAHILAARSAPLSRLELLIDDLVPRKSTRIVVCDAGSGLAMRAAGKLGDFGYSDVAILDGGIDAWKGAGYVLFSGFNVPSKAFGEFVEHHYETPNISAADLHAMIESGEDMVVLDSRPLDEYQRMSIPTGIDVPGAELAYRVHDLAPDPQTTVVVNCAGRTRSIIGAQSLINAGIPNKVLALTNGTMGWVLAGYTCDKGSKNIAPPPGEEGLARAQEAAARVKKRFGVRAANWAEVAEWRQDPMRTLYLLDVRTVEEFEAGHPVGAIHAPGGQLVQGTDSFIGTLNARIVLYDPTGIRNALSASWLIQMNWHDVYVLDGGVEGSDFIQGPHTPFVPGLDEAKCQEIDAAALKALIDGGDTVVMDLADSKTYGAGHIPGAWFAVRSRLDIALAALPPHATLVLTSEDGRLARLVAGEAAAASPANLLMLAGGTKAWADAGNPLSEGPEKMADEADDVFLKAYDGPKGGPEAMQAYIDWETDLPRLIKMDGTSDFKIY